MEGAVYLLVLVALGVIGGAVAGLGGPGGLVVILALNLLVALTPTVAAATASTIFIVATLGTTGLYAHSDGIEWPLVPVVAIPAVVGAHVGTRVAPHLSTRLFELVLVGMFLSLAVGVVLAEVRTGSPPGRTDPLSPAREPRVAVPLLVGCFGIGILAGITGIGGPALTIPLMLVLGLPPLMAIGAGVASGVLITVNSVLGHALQGTAPSLVPLVVVGVPYVFAQLLGWRYVHLVSDRTVSFSIAALAVVGSIVVLV